MTKKTVRGKSAQSKSALIVMDLQRGMLEGADGALDDAEKLLTRVGGIIAKARKRG